MSFHNDFEKWIGLTKKQNCAVCNAEPMPEGMIDLYELPHSWLNSEPVECIKGACHVIAKYHGIELYDLSDEELLGFMKDVQLYAKVLKKVTNAVKINYEIHGNTVPHLHMHLYPRYMDDPFPGKAIDYNQKSQAIYKEGEYEEFVNKMRNELDKLTMI
ncbi:HIT family protein [Oceanirhabdus seepicola]|uniref:HIT family protein n=1 Tax=Oceanirhabdus seepicola TaxID=2828781 RepID=A0A9J6NW14_9CLOT|nr:HIT family protein [Oceanirhabdus seepicola]MCM1988244.1 HIT family protein [Oceanirhabdus seepicola]